jgi:hypothetical protein
MSKTNIRTILLRTMIILIRTIITMTRKRDMGEEIINLSLTLLFIPVHRKSIGLMAYSQG